MTLLKKIGRVILQVVGIASGMLPMFEPQLRSTPTGAKIDDKLDQAFTAIITAEQMFTAAWPNNKTGSDKLRAAMPFIAALVQQSALLAGKKPKNETLFEDASTRLTAALADIMNSYGD